jgi:hypothetical protein
MKGKDGKLNCAELLLSFYCLLLAKGGSCKRSRLCTWQPVLFYYHRMLGLYILVRELDSGRTARYAVGTPQSRGSGLHTLLHHLSHVLGPAPQPGTLVSTPPRSTYPQLHPARGQPADAAAGVRRRSFFEPRLIPRLLSSNRAGLAWTATMLSCASPRCVWKLWTSAASSWVLRRVYQLPATARGCPLVELWLPPAVATVTCSVAVVVVVIVVVC